MTISTRSVAGLPAPQKRMFERARNAMLQRNYSYAFEMLRTLLQAEPGCSEARQALHRVQLESLGGMPTAGVKMGAVIKTFIPTLISGPLLLKKGKVIEALDLAENAMAADPTAILALHFLARAATAAGLTEVATNSLEMCADYHPKSARTLRTLAAHYREIGEINNAIRVLQLILELKPNDLNVENELKQCTAIAAMGEGKWEEAESFRDVLKDKEMAQTLEQQERLAARDEGTLKNLIQAAEKAVTEEPTATTHKRLADLYRQAHEYDKALEQYEFVIERTGTMDPAIDDAIIGVLADRFDDAIAQWREYGAAGPANEEEAAQQVAAIEEQKEEMLFERFKERVRRYPNDTKYRFALGEKLFEREDIDGAMKEFQLSQRNPRLRRNGLAYMGKCLMAKKMTDMAVEQFGMALAEDDRMDKARKDILYHLALAHGETGQHEEALKCLKQIFAADVNYRDVGQRIEQYYQQEQAD